MTPKTSLLSSPRLLASHTNTVPNSFILFYNSVLRASSLASKYHIFLLYHLFLYTLRHVAHLEVFDSLFNHFASLLHSILPISYRQYLLPSTFTSSSTFLQSLSLYSFSLPTSVLTERPSFHEIKHEHLPIIPSKPVISMKNNSYRKPKIYIEFTDLQKHLLNTAIWIKEGCDLLYLSPFNKVKSFIQDEKKNDEETIRNTQELMEKAKTKKYLQLRNRIFNGKYFQSLDVELYATRLAAKRNEHIHINIPQCFYLYVMGFYECFRVVEYYSIPMYEFLFNVWHETCETTHEFLHKLHKISRKQKETTQSLSNQIEERKKQLDKKRYKRKQAEEKLLESIEECRILEKKSTALQKEIMWHTFSYTLMEDVLVSIEKRLQFGHSKVLYYETKGKRYLVTDKYKVMEGLFDIGIVPRENFHVAEDATLIGLCARLKYLLGLNKTCLIHTEMSKKQVAEDGINKINEVMRLTERIKYQMCSSIEATFHDATTQTPFYALLKTNTLSKTTLSPSAPLTPSSNNGRYHRRTTRQAEQIDQLFLVGDITTMTQQEDIHKTQALEESDKKKNTTVGDITNEDKDILPIYLQDLFFFIDEKVSLKCFTKTELEEEIKGILRSLTAENKGNHDASINMIEEHLYDFYQFSHPNDPILAEMGCYRLLISLFRCFTLQNGEKIEKTYSSLLYHMLLIKRQCNIETKVPSFNVMLEETLKQEGTQHKGLDELNEHQIWQLLLSFFGKCLLDQENTITTAARKVRREYTRRTDLCKATSKDEIPVDIYIEEINIFESFDPIQKQYLLEKAKRKGYESVYSMGRTEKKVLCVKLPNVLWWIFNLWQKSVAS